MITLWETVTDFYEEYISSGDPRVTVWFLMASPVPTFVLVSIYVAFVKVIGPAWMKDRKPFDLRVAMFTYNICLVTLYVYFIGDAFKVLFRSGKSLTCRINDMNDPNEFRLAELGWWFYFFKLVEFMDTVFFVLRKKFQHITTLHVVHHSLVPVAVWFGYRAEPASYNYFFPLINSIVHIVMYTYYGLAALGPQVQKHLWWKKYLTTVQMMQFVMVFIYVVSLLLVNCRVSKFIIYLYVFLAALFLLLFCNFFWHTYLKNKNMRGERTKDPRSAQEQKNSYELNGSCTTFEDQELEKSLQKKTR